MSKASEAFARQLKSNKSLRIAVDRAMEGFRATVPLLVAASREAIAEWEEETGIPWPRSEADSYRFAARAGLSPDRILDGQWNTSDIGAILQGQIDAQAKERERAAQKVVPKFLPARALIEHCGVPAGNRAKAAEQKLNRLRESGKLPKLAVRENEIRGTREAKYEYDVKLCRPYLMGDVS